MRSHTLACLVASLMLTGAATARAQQRRDPRVDSLEAEVRALKGRLDSLRLELTRLARRQRADTARAPEEGDDLAALRAAAALAVGGDTTQTADTSSRRTFVGRERNQAQLNPEISVTGDVRAYATTTGVQRDNFDPHEFEVGFQSALDPYAHTKIFVAFGGGEVDVEEGYAYWTGLPGRLRLDVGKYRQPFGELNRWHLHGVPETEYPLVLTSFFGDEGLAGTGISLYRPFGGFGTHEVTLQVTRSGSDAALFGDGGRPTVLARLLNFWQLSRSTYMQLGGSALYGTNPDSTLRTTVAGLDFRFTWRPPARATYREWTVRGELLALRKAVAGTGPTRLGGYVGSTYKLGQRWIAGARYDYVESPETGEITRQLIPSLTMWQSEWVFLRAQYQWQRVASATPTHRFALQAVWAIGPHKHETY